MIVITDFKILFLTCFVIIIAQIYGSINLKYTFKELNKPDIFQLKCTENQRSAKPGLTKLVTRQAQQLFSAKHQYYYECTIGILQVIRSCFLKLSFGKNYVAILRPEKISDCIFSLFLLPQTVLSCEDYC